MNCHWDMVNQDKALVDELKSLHKDQDTTNFGVLDFVGAFGSPLEACAYGKLFWPDLIELDGMVFRRDVLEDELDASRIGECLRRYDGDRAKTEASFNLLEIPSSVFGRRSGESSDDVDSKLAELLGETWRARLRSVFPERSFVVEVDTSPPNGEATVTFYQARD